MAFSEDFLQELASRNDIVDVVGSYVRLTKKSGSNLFGLCPFHSEKTPSFSVAPDKQIYHCFGCGKGGSVISFIMEIENLSFPDAVAFLARRAGMPMPAEEQREAFQAVLEEALDEDLSFEVVQTVHEQLRDMIQEHDQDKTAEPLTISRREMSGMLQSCGVPEEKLTAFEEKYDAEFGQGMSLNAVNIAEPKKFEVRTPDVVVQVNPERSDLVQTRVIDGQRYILIRAEEGVEVNGVNISIAGAPAPEAAGEDAPF